MKKILLCLLSVLSLTVCSCSGPKKVTYEEFYAKTQEIEDHHYSTATITICYDMDMIHEGTSEKTNGKRVIDYTWSDELNKFVASKEEDSGFEDELSRTVKRIYANRPDESEESKGMGYQYFVNPFKVYVDYTDTEEERTIRTIQSETYDKYGYLTSYLLKASASGSYKDHPISGYQKTTYTVSYK